MGSPGSAPWAKTGCIGHVIRERQNNGKKQRAHENEDARSYSRRQGRRLRAESRSTALTKHPVCNGDTFQEVEAMSQGIAGAATNCSPLGDSALSLARSGVHCQELTGVITGQVVDQTDNVLPGARVVITNLHSARVITVATGTSGTYWVPLAPGEYAVRCEATGFARQEVPLVEVRAGRMVTLSAVLRVGSHHRTSRGNSRARALWSTRTAQLSDTPSPSEEINRLPKTRTFNRSR